MCCYCESYLTFESDGIGTIEEFKEETIPLSIVFKSNLDFDYFPNLLYLDLVNIILLYDVPRL